MLGYPRMCHFPGYTFCPKILKQDINFEENSKAGQYFAGKSYKFFVEHMTWSQNEPYCLESGKNSIFISKITENVGKCQN